MKSIAKKICIYALCTCLLFTGVFISYDNSFVVYADDKMSSLDVVKTGIGIALVVVGIVTTVGTGGLSAPALLELTSGVITSAQGVDNIVNNYIHDNGDGTFTMTPEFIRLVLNEAQKIDDTGFHDYESMKNIDGTYHITGYEFFDKTASGDVYNDIFEDDLQWKLVGVYDSSTAMTFYRDYVYGGSASLTSVYVKYTHYVNGEFNRTSSRKYLGAYVASDGTPSEKGANVPIFMSRSAALAAIESGDYSGAINYREKYFDYSNRYAPTYPGGSVRISRSVLDGFEDKLNEVYNMYDDVNDRVDALYEYIFGDGNSGFDFDFDIESPFDLGDWFSGIFNDPFGIGEDIIDSLAGFFSDIANGLKKKFPFSIPWDIYKVFTVFSNVQSPEPASISALSFTDQGEIQVLSGDIQTIANDEHNAPYFKLPIIVESFGIEEEIIVDMKDFQTLSTFSRTMFSLLFAVALLKFTLKVLSIFGVFGGGGDGD